MTIDALATAIRPYRRVAVRDRALRGLVYGLLAAASFALAIELAARSFPFERALPAAAAGAALCVAGGIAWGFTRRPTDLAVARIADARLGLRERLASAVAAAPAGHPMSQLLRADAVRAAGAARPAEAFPLLRHRRHAALVVGLGLLVAVLAILPNARDAELARQRADRATIAAVAGTIARARAAAAANSRDLPAEQAARLDQALKEAQQKVASASTPLQALQELSNLSDRLAQLRDPANASREQAATAAGAALTGAPGAAQLSRDLQQGNHTAAAAGLRSLGASLRDLTPAQQAQLSQALKSAAAAAAGDPKLQQSLDKASSSLAGGNTAAAQSALDAAAQASADQGAQQSFESALAQAQAATAGARQQAASQANADSQAQAQGTGQGQGQGQGNGSGTGSGQGTGSGSGSGQGTGAGSGAGRGGTGSAANEPIYVTGQPGTGLNQPDPGPLGDGQPVPQAGFRDVYGAYLRDAADALDRSAYDAGSSDLIHQYFTSLDRPR